MPAAVQASGGGARGDLSGRIMPKWHNPIFLRRRTRQCAASPKKGGGRLADIAPTMLQLLGIDQPAAMTGESLIAE